MDRSKLILNTIVFKADLDKGVSQQQLLSKAKDLGISRLEIRREFLSDPLSELPAIRTEADRLDLSLFYSVSEDLILKGKLHPDLRSFLSEARILGAPFVKLNTGSAQGVTVKTLAPLKGLLSEGPGLAVENNQVPGHATIANCSQMMAVIQEARLPIGFVFDTGNWIWLGESVTEAAKTLAPVISYLHCKNYVRKNGQLQLSGLFEGEADLPSLLKQFPELQYLALEYPCSDQQLRSDIDRLLAC